MTPLATAVHAVPAPPPPGPRRRTALRAVGALTAAGVVASAVGAPAATATPRTSATPAAPAGGPRSVFAPDATRHLLRRTTFGLNPTVLADVTRLGVAAWLEAQLTPSTIADPVEDLIADRLPRLGWSTATVRAGYATPSADLLEDLLTGTVARAVWSTRQLQEVMVDLWSNHLNAPVVNADLWATRHTYDQVIRTHALGSFAALLREAVTHPAMLQYLNADRSTVRGLNENLGRELLELHTVGRAAGYTQAEVLDSARILTGLGQDAAGRPVFRPEDHVTGPVAVLGFRHANSSPDGREVVRAYLEHLALHPATARTVATTLAVRFVSDAPPAALVDRLAKVYLRNRSAIVPVLRALFASDEFAAAAGLKTRRPYEDVYATLRAMDLAPGAATAATWRLGVQLTRFTGHVPLHHPTPDGHPDVAAAYTSAALQLHRLNLHQVVPWGAMADLPVPPAYVHGPLTTLGAALDAVALRFVGSPLRPAHHRAVLAFTGLAADTDVRSWTWRRAELLLAPVLLDSPYFTQR